GGELVAVLAFDLGVRPQLHDWRADRTRLALLHGAHLPQPRRVRLERHAALVLRGVRGGEAGAVHVLVCALRPFGGAGAAQARAPADAQLAGGVVPGPLALRIEVGPLLHRRVAGVPDPGRLRRIDAPAGGARPALGSGAG